MGGYREGSGRAKFGYYKGIYCGSTYELCWVIYNIDNKIPFKRFEGYLSDGNLKYYPDFILENNTIVEIKGYNTPEVDKKTQLAIDKGYNIKVLYKKDLQYAFEYVKKQYAIKNKQNFHTLYDGHKPSYELTCNNCNKLYFTEVKPKKEINFCSRVCSGKYRFKKNEQTLRELEVSPPVQRKLTDEQVKEIYLMQGSKSEIAKKFNINKSLVYFIKHKQIHKKLLNNLE